MPAKKRTSTKKAAASNQKVLDAVSGLSAEAVIDQIGDLQISLQATLAGLGAAVTSRVEQMKNVEEAIAIKESELKEVYEIEKEAMDIEEMKALKEKESNEWEKEKSSRLEEWEDEAEEREKRWLREEEEHAYNVKQKIFYAEQEHSSLVEGNRRKELIRQEELVRKWNEREAEISSKEGEFEEMKAKVAGFDEELKSEVKKAESIVENRLKKQYDHETQLLQKDIEAERNLHSIKVSAMDDIIRGLEEQIDDLQKDLACARSDAKEVTNAALNSASGRQVIEALSKSDNSGNSPSKK